MSAIDPGPGKGTELTNTGAASKKLNDFKNEDEFDDNELNDDELSEDRDDPDEIHDIYNEDDVDPAYGKKSENDIAFDDDFDDEEFEDERDDY